MIGAIAAQDLAIMFIAEEERLDQDRLLQDDRAPVFPQPDIPRLLDVIAVSCPVCTGLKIWPRHGPVSMCSVEPAQFVQLVPPGVSRRSLAACKPSMHGLTLVAMPSSMNTMLRAGRKSPRSRPHYAQARQTLALGDLPTFSSTSPLTRNAQPLPPSLSRLTALTSLALLGITWEHAPAGLPHMPQVRQSQDSPAHCGHSSGLAGLFTQ